MTDRTNWFIDLETKANMNSGAIGVIEVIMGDIHTTAEEKVAEIALTLEALNQAWSIKKPSALTESQKEIFRTQCTIDISKIESLVDRAWAEEVLRKEG